MGRGRSKDPVPKKNAQKQQQKKQQQKGGNKKKDGKPQPKKEQKQKPLTAEALDRSMDDYWAKSEDKTIVEKKLNDDLDAYWAAKKGGGDNEEAREGSAGDGTSDVKKSDEKEAG